jgi:hypothetical protein
MSQELNNATLKKGANDGITLYEDQSASIDLSDYIDLELITGESIPYPYTGSPITESEGILIGKTVSNVSASGNNTAILYTDGSISISGYLKDDYSNIDGNFNKHNEFKRQGLGIGKIIKIKNTNIDNWANGSDLFVLTDDDKFLNLHEVEPIIETDVIDFACAYFSESVMGLHGALVSNKLKVIKTSLN